MKNLTVAIFTLALKSPAHPEGWPCIDIFTIKGDGVPLLDIHFAHSDENEDQSAKVVSVMPGFDASNLPRIINAFDLIGKINDVLCEALSESGDEFFSNVFYDEDYELIELPIDFAVMGV